jgi:drug/metabolite transporter (DMT)-like permease
LGIVLLVRRQSLTITPGALRLFAIIACVGTIAPNSASYTAAIHLPAGFLAVIIATVPMFGFPIAVMMGNETFAKFRLLGLFFGLCGVMLLVLPEARLPDSSKVGFIFLAVIAPLCYGFEGNYVARFGTQNLNPVATLFGASCLGALATLPFALLSGHWIDPRLPWGAPDLALIASATLHAFAYTSYVWLVKRAGPVFALQVSYAVTIFAVFWAIILLNEQPSLFLWAALSAILIGMFLVQPRR